MMTNKDYTRCEHCGFSVFRRSKHNCNFSIDDINKAVLKHRKSIMRYLREVSKIYSNKEIKQVLQTCIYDIKINHEDTLPKKRK